MLHAAPCPDLGSCYQMSGPGEAVCSVTLCNGQLVTVTGCGDDNCCAALIRESGLGGQMCVKYAAITCCPTTCCAYLYLCGPTLSAHVVCD